MLLAEKWRESVGKAAREYDTPIMESGTEEMFNEKVYMDMDPAAIREARETRKIVAIWFKDKLIVRGKESPTTRLMDAKLNRNLKRGKSPIFHTYGSCMAMWRSEPKDTPQATPMTPKRGASTRIPKIMAAL